MDIYSAVTGKSHEEIEKEFEGQGYGVFKEAVGEAVVSVLKPLQERYEEQQKQEKKDGRAVADTVAAHGRL